MANHILFLMADGFEESEVVVPFDILLRGQVQASLASISGKLLVSGAHGLNVIADMLLSEVDTSLFSGIFVPGGSRGVENLRNSAAVLKLVRTFRDSGKWVAAICAGPTVLAAADILQDKEVTGYPSTEGELQNKCGAYSKDRVVVDGKVVTSQGPGTAEEFGFRLLSLLEGSGRTEDVRRGMISRE